MESQQNPQPQPASEMEIRQNLLPEMETSQPQIMEPSSVPHDQSLTTDTEKLPKSKDSSSEEDDEELPDFLGGYSISAENSPEENGVEENASSNKNIHHRFAVPKFRKHWYYCYKELEKAVKEKLPKSKDSSSEEDDEDLSDSCDKVKLTFLRNVLTNKASSVCPGGVIDSTPVSRCEGPVSSLGNSLQDVRRKRHLPKRYFGREADIEFPGSRFSRTGSFTLKHDLKYLFKTGEDSDITINVKGHEIRAHKSILRARSHVFFSMFSRDMVENQADAIDIDDCDPEDFRNFLICLYSGELETVFLDNAFNIYRLGEKYAVEDVKKNCVIYMLKYLSVKNFCDYVVFAQRHKETAILEAATEFFTNNLKNILKTEKWLDFLRKHPEKANELHLKAADHYIK